MLTLYGSRGSGSAAAEMALVASGAPYSLVQASRWEAGLAFDELQKLNPLGQIPTLVLGDGTVLTESAAIQLHLALAYPTAGLLPQDPSARAQCLRRSLGSRRQLTHHLELSIERIADDGLQQVFSRREIIL